MQILRADRFGQPSVRLCRFHLFLHLGNFFFLLFNHLCKLFFALFSRLGVYIELFTLSVGKPWIEATFPKVIVDLIHASCATLAYLSLVGLKFLLRRGFRGGWVHLPLGGSTLCVNSGICAFVPPISRSILTAACCCIVSVMWL